MAFAIWGGVFAFLAVALGAFGAHVLGDKLSTEMMSVYHTGDQYQMYHALALIAVGILLRLHPDSRLLSAAGWLFAVGIVLFLGSLYALSISGVKVLGAITPIGGLCFLAGWICFILALAR